MLESENWGIGMVTFRVSADVKPDRRVVLTLPEDVPTGKAELVVSVAPACEVSNKRPRSSLAQWADENAEHWGNRLSAADVEGFTGRSY